MVRNVGSALADKTTNFIKKTHFRRKHQKRGLLFLMRNKGKPAHEEAEYCAVGCFCYKTKPTALVGMLGIHCDG